MFFPILAIFLLIVLHELAHYAVGRYYGMSVKAFSIGFGPSWTIRRDKKGTDWKIAILPLGGFVSFVSTKELQPMRDSDFVGPPTEEMIRLNEMQGKPFEEISLPKRIQVLLAGPFANLLAVYPLVLAFLLLTSATIKQNEMIISDGVTQLINEMNQSGLREFPELKTGDRISEINGYPVLTPQGIKGQLEMSRLVGYEEIEVIVDKRYATEHEYIIDVDDASLFFELVDYKKSDSFSNAYRILLHDLIRGSIQGFTSLPEIILHQTSDHSKPQDNQSKEVSNDDSATNKSNDDFQSKTERVSKVLDSPIMMVKSQSDILDQLDTTSQKAALLFLGAALISMGIGLFNLLPLVPLDGGQVVLNILSGAKEEGLIYPSLYTALMAIYFLLSLVCFLALIILSIGGDIFELLT